MLRVKPIISPTAQGAKKVGTARNQKEQVAFALERLQKTLKRDTRALIMLEFSDNRAWVKQTLKKCFEDQFPAAEIMVQPLSLTSGVHMGPGTWGVAYLPDG